MGFGVWGLGFRATNCLRTTQTRNSLPYKGNIGIIVVLSFWGVLKQIVVKAANVSSLGFLHSGIHEVSRESQTPPLITKQRLEVCKSQRALRCGALDLNGPFGGSLF